MSNAERLLWFMLGVLGGIMFFAWVNSLVMDAVRWSKACPVWPI